MLMAALLLPIRSDAMRRVSSAVSEDIPRVSRGTNSPLTCTCNLRTQGRQNILGFLGVWTVGLEFKILLQRFDSSFRWNHLPAAVHGDTLHLSRTLEIVRIGVVRIGSNSFIKRVKRLLVRIGVPRGIHQSDSHVDVVMPRVRGIERERLLVGLG